MRLFLAPILLIALLPASSCQSPPKPPVPSPVVIDASSDAGTDDAYDVMCAHLVALSCPEGIAKNCAASARKASKLTTVPAKCLAGAIDKNAARLCGFVKCP